jgi:hypothetical protein
MKKRLLILADLGHLKAFRLTYNAPGLKPKLELITTFSTQEASGRLKDKLTDSPEMFRSDAPPGNAQSVRSSGERHNMQLEFARRAVKEIGRQISDIILNEPDGEECILAARREIHGQLLDHIQPRARDRIVANWPEDLTNMPNGGLVGRVDKWEREPVEA